MVKFATDGAVLNRSRMAVQATVKLIDVDKNGKPLRESKLPKYLQKELCVYYYIGKNHQILSMKHNCTLYFYENAMRHNHIYLDIHFTR